MIPHNAQCTAGLLIKDATLYSLIMLQVISYGNPDHVRNTPQSLANPRIVCIQCTPQVMVTAVILVITVITPRRPTYRPF